MVTITRNSVGDLLFGRTRQAVLGLLFMRPDESFHLRQIVRLTGSGLGPVQREVSKLATAGLVLREQRGRQVFYSVNRTSPVYEELRGLVLKTAGLAELLREALMPLRDRIRCAFVFGSFARGEHGRDSDLDLMVIGEAQLAELAKALGGTQRRLGREVNPTVYRAGELARKLAEGHHFVTEVVAGPKIYLLGDDDELRRVARAGSALLHRPKPRVK
jgi:predicted nucleotidyltransferase